MFCCLVSNPVSASAPGALEIVARACSPRIECVGDDAVVFDAGGLTRVLGGPFEIGREIGRLARAHGINVRMAFASTMTAAWLIAHARPGLTVVNPGDEASALAPLPVGWLSDVDADILTIFDRWGVRTLGDLARLPRSGVRARLGAAGVECHRAACGEALGPLVPAGDPVRFVERLDLEWPIDGLEPLSFVLARVCDALAGALERADRGAVSVRTSLKLVTRHVHERTLHLPAPIGSARVLRTLILLDLESHRPEAAIDGVEIELGVAPGPIVQGSLLARAIPSVGELATLVARLRALLGESRVGAPALVDSHDERAVGMKDFAVRAEEGQRAKGRGQRKGIGERVLPLVSSLRRFRPPRAARVVAERGAPVRVGPARGLSGGRIVHRAGPWRSSGGWWAVDRSRWDRDEWEVEVAGGEIYRLARDRGTGRWEVEGIYD